MLLDNPSFTQSTDRGYSPGLWNDAPSIQALRNNPTLGWFFDLDCGAFRTAANVNAAEAYWAQGCKVFGSDGAVIAAADERGGAITLSSDGDNEGVSIGQMIYPFQIDRALGKVWFECRLKTSTIADTKHGFFVGLIDSSALSATVPIAANGTLADENFVGFHRLEGDGDYVDTVYKADGVTQVTVASDAQVLVADTYIKLGFKFDPSDNVLRFFVNGTQLTTTKTIPTADGTDFPNDVRLGFVFALLNATGTTPGSTTISMARVIQTPVDGIL